MTKESAERAARQGRLRSVVVGLMASGYELAAAVELPMNGRTASP